MKKIMIIKNKGKKDFLISAVSYNHNYKILTTDQDFEYFKQYIPIILL
jgi:predicted nucleic acid-binding protein